MVIDRKALFALAASVLVRVPNFILPVIVARIFPFFDYSIFAIGFVTASAVSAFIGEAIAATISRESYRINLAKSSRNSLFLFFQSIILYSYFLIVFFVICYWIFVAHVDADSWMKALSTILLVPAYLLPVTTTSLATASGNGEASVSASLIGIPLSIGLSLLAGAMFGIYSFLTVYFLCVLATNGYVYFKIKSVHEVSSVSHAFNMPRGYALMFMSILFPFMFGGPIHGLCLSILGQQESGVTELSKFVAFYPWCLVVSIISGVFCNYNIQSIVEVKMSNDAFRLKRYLLFSIFGNFALSAVMAFLLWLSRDVVFLFYSQEFPWSQILFGTMLICGISATCLNSASQIIIGIGGGKGMLLGSGFQAIFYVSTAYVLINEMGLGAEGLVIALTISQFMLALIYMIMIFIGVRRISKG